MNLIAAAARLWSDLTWWHVLAVGAAGAGLLILLMWLDGWLERMKREEAAQQPNNSTVHMSEWYAKRRAEVEARRKQKGGDAA